MNVKEIRLKINIFIINRVDILSTLFLFIILITGVTALSSEPIAEEKTYAEIQKGTFELKRKADIIKRIKNDFGHETPLYNDLQELILDYYDVDSYIKLNESLLESAKNGDWDFFQSAVRNGADIKNKDIKGDTAYDLAENAYWGLYNLIDLSKVPKDKDSQPNEIEAYESKIQKLTNYRKILEFLASSDKK